ncbi:MAG: nucleoside diphosphate kinase regulator [Shinella sp.]|nr:nucleoside diphosphate kinase regulator [Shinella sp.]
MNASPADRAAGKPDITISETDHRRLTRLAEGLYENAPQLAETLLTELERARTCPAGAVPADTVQMGSSVEYGTDEGQRRRVTLVYPQEAEIESGKVSILTPIGAALIGLSPGQSIDWTARDGRTHRLTVLSVENAAAGPA